MSLDVLTAIWRDPPCKGGDLLCLLAIADNADENGYAYPSVSTIARKAAMSDRGARKCLKNLSEMGLISVDPGGGRNNTNGYQVTTNGIGAAPEHKNPEQYSGNTVPPLEPETLNNRAETLNPGSINPEPRFTRTVNNHQEPPKNKEARAIRETLSRFAKDDAISSFIAWRRKIKKPLTLTAAKRLAKQLEEISNKGGDPCDALGMVEEKGWQSLKADWYFRERNAQNEHPGTSRQRTHHPPGNGRQDSLASIAARRRADGQV